MMSSFVFERYPKSSALFLLRILCNVEKLVRIVDFSTLWKSQQGMTNEKLVKL